MQAILQAWQANHCSTQHSIPPAPQEAQKEETNDEENAEITAEKQAPRPLYQATVEDDIESTTKQGNSMPDNKSTLSSIPRLCTTPSSGDSAARLSTAPLLACQHAIFLAWHGLLPGCIEYSKGIEATGQG